MKIVHLPLLAFFSLLGSCENQKTPEVELSNAATTNDSDCSTCDCFSTDYEIYPETTVIWEATWDMYHNIDSVNAMIYPPLFDKDSLNQLRNLGNFDGVRAYYGLMDEYDEIPAILLVNVDGNCNDAYQENQLTVLLGYDSTCYFITPEEGAIYTENWENQYSNQDSIIHTPVQAYNYDWSILNDVMDENGGVYFRYGFRTLSPGDSTYYSNDTTRFFGSVVYCNMIYGEYPDETSTVLPARYDFAMPCPQACGNASLLNTFDQ